MKMIVSGLAVNYSDQGEGPVIVLLHGWGLKLETFEQLAHDLSVKYRVIRLDLPGFGGSQRPDSTWGVGEYAQFVASFLKKLKVSDVLAVIGHSFGGRIGIKGVGRGILKPEKLILMGSAGIKYSDSLRSRGFRGVAKVGKVVLSLPLLSLLRDKSRQRLYKAAGATDYLKTGSMRDIFIVSIEEDLRPDAAGIGVPTLMIWGHEDEITPVKDAYLLAKPIKDVRIEVLPQATHAVYLDQPDKAAGLIMSFLE